MKNLNRDRIDFGTMSIPALYVRLFVPTLLGLVFGAMMNLADGIFVGRGVGSDALASVNIAAPIFLISSATALMFASGASIVAAVHLAQNNLKAARINVTQAFAVPSALMALFSVLILIFAPQLCYLFGGTARLEPYVTDYLHWVSPMPLLNIAFFVGAFVIRLDGAPRYAMLCNVVPSVMNFFLDWLFIFPFGKGIAGAGIATTISFASGALMVLFYMQRRAQKLLFYRLKLTPTSAVLTLRNVRAMARLGLSTFIGDGAISYMMILGNFVIIHYLKEDGIAAFSVCCYLFPLIFMFGNAIAQSQLPIISYNLGLRNVKRIRQTFRFSLILAASSGVILSACAYIYRQNIISMFLDPGTNAFEIAMSGFGVYAASFACFSLNIVIIGFLQSVEKTRTATLFMLLRGVIALTPAFLLLPWLLGPHGVWLAVPLSETLSLGLELLYLALSRKQLAFWIAHSHAGARQTL